jgi:molecular chaperone DnaK (HSP70)
MAIVSIDFGTSNTVVAVQVDEKVTIWRFGGLTREFDTPQGVVAVVPSLGFKSSLRDPTKGAWLWGEQVRSLAIEQLPTHRYWHSFKRELVADIRTPDRAIDGEYLNSSLVAELFLKRLLGELQTELDIQQLIFTAPVGAFNSYLQWFRRFTNSLYKDNFSDNSGTAPQVLLVDESTAAALGYAITQPNLLIMVVDFGGGTLDISLVRTIELIAEKQALQAEVVAKACAYIGGVDIDQWIAEYWLEQNSTLRSSLDQRAWLALLQRAEQAKLHFPSTGEYQLSPTQLTDILEARSFLDQLRSTLDEALETALQKGISKSAIAQVLLVGGSCLLAPVQDLVCAYFGKQRVKLQQPFTAVAQGALVLGSQAWVRDYLHHSYGIRLWDGFRRQYQFYPLFGKGTKYPTRLAKPLILQVAMDGQTQVILDIGEVADTAQAEVSYDRDGKMTASQLLKVTDFQSLQSISVHLEPAGSIAADRLAVDFAINHDRVLEVSITDLLTGELLSALHQFPLT